MTSAPTSAPTSASTAGHTATSIALNTWTAATWKQYLTLVADPAYSQAKGYYYNGFMRLEMSPLGNPHSRDHASLIFMLSLFAGIKGIDLDVHDNCSFRKMGYGEVQPDVAIYVDDRAEMIPWDVTIVDLDCYPAPDLTIEVAASSLADDKGEKRLLYESLGVREYWIVDVTQAEILAFSVHDRGSFRIDTSAVLPGLEIALLVEALRRSRESNHGKVSTWLLQEFQK